MTDINQLRDGYRAKKTALFEDISTSGPSARGIHSTMRHLAREADQVLKQLWHDAALPASFSLVAVGGFGRGELFPSSDVDVLVLLPAGTQPEADSALKGKLEQFIGQCWDAGLEIGSSVRTEAECLAEAAKDVTVQTSLLESRLITGSRKLYTQLRAGFEAAIDPHAFYTAKLQELRQRHAKYEDTPYALEPNCKESPGGLRDLQVVQWVARAAGFGKTWDELSRNGLITPFEARQIKHNEAFLSLVRARLHLASRRREDRLVFDLQQAVAAMFGYEAQDGHRASEQLMKHYYWAAKAVTQLNQILLLNISERLNPGDRELRPINERFFEKAGLIEVARDDLYFEHPHAILETFYLYQTLHAIRGLSARTLRALYNARDIMDSAFRHDPVNRATFMRMLQAPEGQTHVLRLLNETSVLGRYLWPFRRIVGQMQHDLFHVYTVDQHILMVLRNVRRFFMAEHAHEYPMCAQLAAGWDKPWLLYIAALFHDIAKGRGGDHSELGAIEVRRFCKQHAIDHDDAELIEFLVAEHLTMSSIAQKQDLSDPAVINAFVERVGSERKLTALYLLTVADIRGTSPKVWNAWKGKLLEDFYRYSLRAMGGRLPDADAQVELRKREAIKQLALSTALPNGQETLWSTLDVRYFMRHDAGDIAWHTRQLGPILAKAASQKAADGQPRPVTVVRARFSPVGEGLQVMVYTPDQPALFASLCAYFEQHGFSILDAKVHTTNDGHALDTFQIVSSLVPEHYRELVSMIENELPQTIANPDAQRAPGRGRVSRRVKSFPVQPQVEWQADEKAQNWVLDIIASDRVGALHAIAHVLGKHGVNLQMAKITTLGERIEDTFLISGATLTEYRNRNDIENELLEALKA
ncbi:MAG: Bifunctional uridylyltransferase/uridylyl-removing enzyme [Paracidovorax wautersii]|uniref:Bifunctional uridylyltransferase/uridylyl-removing enzyme n=1 Tax=Paracidovorax wautersii TaxID=1177982 RepID=A0A7V8JNJ6_9BURK|nr:MAG: Bifunctional uridylyltransferase/uridylyl-removing enzyme [Paracidovorax wautersii]